jgi:hypothetical protein
MSVQMWEMYESKIAEARSIDGQEGFMDGFVSDTFTAFRG